MPTVDDTQVVGGTMDKTKQELQQALLDLLKGNPEILNSVTQTATKQGGHATAESFEKLYEALKRVFHQATRSGDEDGRKTQKSPSMSLLEDENQLNQQRRGSYQWQFSDSDDGTDSAWTTATKNMSPRELSKWRRGLFSVYAGHLPYDITKKELMQLFSEVGNVQDVHLQPASQGSHTYGFVRYLTLEECSDAVSMLHGRLLGNRTITVEYACETQARLNENNPSDLPLNKKDKLLRNDYPKADHLYRPMSDAESQEKMILWKLRCSATRQKSNGQETKEELMSRIQEIVKKVASLPEETRALPSGSEGSPCSPWILKEINGNYISGEMAQPHLCTEKHEDQDAVFNISETQVTGVPPVAVVKHSPNMALTSTEKDHVSSQMLPEKQEPTMGTDTITFSHPSNTQRVVPVHGPFQDTVSSDDSGSPGRNDGLPNHMEHTASDSASLGSLSSPERSMTQHCQFCHSLSPTRGHASESSQSESTTSSSSWQSPTSPCKLCHEKEEFLSIQDDCPPLAEQGLPQSESRFRDMGLCSFEAGHDHVKNSDSSEIPEAKPTSMPTPYPNKEPMSVANGGSRPQQGLLSDTSGSDKSDLVKEGQKQMQSSSDVPHAKKALLPSPHCTQEQIHVANQGNRPFLQQPLLNDSAFTSFLGQPQHIQAMWANMVASGWQQPGFPRYPFLGPGAMNPGIFEGWNRNLLLQQQLLAARMPFGSPFLAGGHQSRHQSRPRFGFGVRGPVPHQGQGDRMPFGRTNMGPAGRGRLFAPRFYNPGAENLKTHEASDSLKSSMRPTTNPASTSTTVGSERSLPVDKNILEASDSKVKSNSIGANDSPKVRPSTSPTSPENTKVHIELASRESSTPAPSQEHLTPEKDKGIKPVSEAANSTPSANLPRQKRDLESPSKMSQSELLLKEEKAELKRVVKENERLRQCIDWQNSARTAYDDPRVKRDDIHNKEVQLQKEKEIVMARKAEQILLYERAKLEAAFDPQLKKELETEKKLGETKNKIYLAKLENDLLRSCQDLHGTINCK